MVDVADDFLKGLGDNEQEESGGVTFDGLGEGEIFMGPCDFLFPDGHTVCLTDVA